MRQEFLGELLEMEALCSVLCCLHNAQPEVGIPAARTYGAKLMLKALSRNCLVDVNSGECA